MAVVVFPTPPFWLATATTRVIDSAVYYFCHLAKYVPLVVWTNVGTQHIARQAMFHVERSESLTILSYGELCFT